MSSDVWGEISKRLKTFLKSIALRVVLTDETRKRAIEIMNKKLNTGLLTEAQEAEFLAIAWDSAEQAIKEALEDW